MCQLGDFMLHHANPKIIFWDTFNSHSFIDQEMEAIKMVLLLMGAESWVNPRTLICIDFTRTVCGT